MHQMVMLPLKGTSTGWRNGLIGASSSSTNENAKCYTWRGITSCISSGEAEKAWVLLMGTELDMRVQQGHPCSKGDQQHPGLN